MPSSPIRAARDLLHRLDAGRPHDRANWLRRRTIIKRVDLELGGNGPFVVLADADLEQAVEAAVFGKFLHQGQICIAINRIIVERENLRPLRGTLRSIA